MRLKNILILASLIISTVMVFVAMRGLPHRPTKLFKPSLVSSFCKVGTLVARHLYAELSYKQILFWGNEGIDEKVLDCFLAEFRANKVNFKEVNFDSLVALEDGKKYIVKGKLDEISKLVKNNKLSQLPKVIVDKSVSIYFSEVIPDLALGKECVKDEAKLSTIPCLSVKMALELEQKNKGKSGTWMAGEQVAKGDIFIYYRNIK